MLRAMRKNIKKNLTPKFSLNKNGSEIFLGNKERVFSLSIFVHKKSNYAVTMIAMKLFIFMDDVFSSV